MNERASNNNTHAPAVAASVADGSAAARVQPDVLSLALQRHQTWLGSGWEMGARADLHGADLHGAGLSGAILEIADLHSADLHRAVLGDADLEGADLHRADLHRADLLATRRLSWADLAGCRPPWRRSQRRDAVATPTCAAPIAMARI